MKKLILIVSLLSVFLIGCQSEQVNITEYENITQDPDIMQSAWCDYNKGKEFVTDQCDNINE